MYTTSRAEAKDPAAQPFSPSNQEGKPVPAGSFSHQLEIRFCDRCGHRGRALELANDVLQQWASELAGVLLVPVDEGFAVALDGEPIFSKSDPGDTPEAGEINSLLEARLGPPPGFGA
jgi:predicted Rdx family selenoprotein